MLQEAAQKLFVSQSHRTALIVMGIVLPAERHLCFGDIKDPMVGDRDTMRVASQILQHMFWPAKWWFGVDHPILTKKRAQEGGECLIVYLVPSKEVHARLDQMTVPGLTESQAPPRKPVVMEGDVKRRRKRSKTEHPSGESPSHATKIAS